MGKILLSLAIGCFLFFLSDAQTNQQAPVLNRNWVDLMENPNANFYDIQKAFNNAIGAKEKAIRQKHLKERDEEEEEEEIPGGFLPFKRWENFWKPRVYPSGVFPDPAIVYTELNKEQNKTRQRGTPVTPGTPTTAAVSNWTSLGPSNIPSGGGAGRVTCIRFNPTNSNIIYIGTAAGGVWKSTNGGTGWTTNTTTLPVLGVSDILIDPTNTNIMYLATGDGDAADTYSVGVLKSTDGGTTWNTTGLNWAVSSLRRIYKMIMHPTNPSIILAATSNGVYKTSDGGATWSQKLAINVKDIEFNTSNPTIVYTSGTSYYRSTTTGDSFSQVTTGLPTTGIQRIAVGVTANDANYIYLLIANSTDYGLKGIYRSIDGGLSFSTMVTTPNMLGWNADGSDAGGQGWYDLSIAVNPGNKLDVYIGGVNHWRSTNGGTSWTSISHWYGCCSKPYVHADVHAIEFLPGSTTTLFSGNDGGIFRTTTNGSSWTDLSAGLNVAQMYRLSCSATNSSIVLAGHQDNGTNRYNGASWSEVIGGDGMECIVDYTNSSIQYGELYYGDIRRSTGGSFSTIVSSGGTGVNEDGDWVTPYILHPTTNTTMLVGKSQVYRSTNSGTSFSQLGTISGGSGLLIALAYAPSDANYIYAAKVNRLFVTSNGGTTWIDRSAGLPTASASITYIAVDPANPQRVWVTFSGYSSGNKVFYSANAGAAWTNVSGSLPNLPVNCIVYDKNSSDGLYIGTDVGAYYRSAASSDWETFSTGLPNVIVAELDIQYSSGKIRAATYGRGLWESPLNTACAAPTNPSASASATNVCAGVTVNLSSGATNATSYSWTGPNSYSSSQQNPSISNIQTNQSGTYTVTASNACGSTTAAVTVTVNATNAVSVSIGANPSGAICAGTNVTFTATPTNGGASPSYQWKLNGNNVGTNSATYSNASLGNGNVVSCVLTSNVSCPTGNPATSSDITMAVNPIVTTSISIAATPTTPICPNTTITFTATPTNGGSTPAFQWKLNGNDVGSNSTTYSTSTPANNDTVKCVLTSNATCVLGNPATSNPAVVTVRNDITPAQPGAISVSGGTAKVCPGDTRTYKITAVAGATGYSWTPPTGAQITAGQGTVQVIINYTAGFTAAGTLSVVAVNGCTNSTARTLAINRNTPASPSVISGGTYQCPNTSANFSVTLVSNVTYNWTAPANATIGAGQGTNSVTVNFSPTFTSGPLTVTASNACGTSAVRSLTINSVPTTPGIITGPATNNCSTTSAFSIRKVTGATSYIWTTNIAGAVVTPDALPGDTAASIAFPIFTSGTVTVKATNFCGNSAARNLTVKGTTATPGTISGATAVTPCINQPYSISPVAGATSYTWTVPTGSTILSGQGTPSISVKFGTTSGNITVKGVNACGNSTAKTLAVTVGACRLLMNGSMTHLNIYPNPTSGAFTVAFYSTVSRTAAIEIKDLIGSRLYIKEFNVTAGDNSIIINDKILSRGIYFLYLDDTVTKLILQ